MSIRHLRNALFGAAVAATVIALTDRAASVKARDWAGNSVDGVTKELKQFLKDNQDLFKEIRQKVLEIRVTQTAANAAGASGEDAHTDEE